MDSGQTLPGQAAARPDLPPMRLDSWFRLINQIYIARNFYRTPESLMCHLVEVIGGLSVVASDKTRLPSVQGENVSEHRWLAKSLGWWMALCGVVGIKSVEELVWAKFPYACPYCQLKKHDDSDCEQARIKSRDPNWGQLADRGKENRAANLFPMSLGEWQAMFQVIYPRRKDTNHASNFSHLMEELGELAEAVRALRITKSYFYSEAADVFAWLMGVANQLKIDELKSMKESRPWHENPELLTELTWQEYPGICRYCKGRLCTCPPFPAGTIGRIVHDGPPSIRQERSSLFSVEEIFEYFSSRSEFVRFDNRIVEITEGFFREATKLAELLNKLIAQQQSYEKDARHLVDLAATIEAVGSKQSSVDEALERIEEQLSEDLPPSVSEVLMSFAINAGSSIWGALILKALGGG